VDGRERGLGYLKESAPRLALVPDLTLHFCNIRLDFLPGAKGILGRADNISGIQSAIDILWALQ